MASQAVTRNQLAADLRALGVQAGQTVMLHASVKAIGHVVGGPDMVLQALLDVLTPDGTVMMYISWEGSPYFIMDWPEQWQQAYREDCPAFDPATSRGFRGWSILTEYLRTWPGARRSGHPDASFAAVGRHAEYITRDHPLQYGYGPGSPLAKLVELDGAVLLLGSPLRYITLLHHAEHMADVPNKPVFHYRMPMLVAGRKQWVEIEEYDTERLIDDWQGETYFELIPRAFLGAGYGRSGLVGAAEAQWLPAREVYRFAREWLETNIGKART